MYAHTISRHNKISSRYDHTRYGLITCCIYIQHARLIYSTSWLSIKLNVVKNRKSYLTTRTTPNHANMYQNCTHKILIPTPKTHVVKLNYPYLNYLNSTSMISIHSRNSEFEFSINFYIYIYNPSVKRLYNLRRYKLSTNTTCYRLLIPVTEISTTTNYV